MPRNITERLVGKRTFEEADAWLDLWCHTTYGDYGNAFSFLGPAIQYGKYGSVLTLDNLGKPSPSRANPSQNGLLITWVYALPYSTSG